MRQLYIDDDFGFEFKSVIILNAVVCSIVECAHVALSNAMAPLNTPH